MLRNKNTKDRKLAMQGLEKRELMAGDVGVGLQGGMLSIVGDNADNYVQVSQVAEGEFKVSGFYSDGSSTRINGQSKAQTFKGVEGINVQLAGGQDRLNLIGTTKPQISIRGDLNVQMGTGNDEVHIEDFWVGGDADIATDNKYYANARYQGDDLLKITNFMVNGHLGVTTSEGADQVNFNVTNDGWNVFSQGFSLDTGAGTYAGDTVMLVKVMSGKSIDVNMGQGDDFLYGHNLLAYEGDITINTHQGNDFVGLDSSNMDWQLTKYKTSVIINTGSGNDVVALYDIDVRGDVRVDTSAGNDSVYMANVHARDNLYANLGSGDDYLSITRSSAAVASLYGGSSSRQGDELFAEDNDFDRQNINGWERY